MILFLFFSGCSTSTSGTKQFTSNDIDLNDTYIKRKLFIIGDSTVNYSIDFSEESQKAFLGWGEVLYQRLKDPTAVYNGARYGASAKSYRVMPVPPLSDTKYSLSFGKNRNLTWKETKKEIEKSGKKGDYLLIQFGSNDKHMYQKPEFVPRLYGQFEGLSIYSPEIKDDFKKELQFYIDQARELGLKPVLISAINPRHYDRAGNVIDEREPFPQYIKELADEEGIPYLDLHQKSMEEYAKYHCGDLEFKESFGNCQVGNHTISEITHLKPKGAKIVAGWIKELACQKDEELCSQFR